MPKLPVKYFKTVTEYAKYNWSGAIDKLYPVVKTVTKDFTRTDPVYVRIGDDGEPEIHYTMTNVSDATDYFKSMNLGNASFYCHGCGKFAAMAGSFNAFRAKKLSIDSLASCARLESMFLGITGPNDGYITIEMPSDTAKITSLSTAFSYGPLRTLPLFDTSGLTSFIDFILLYHVKEIPAYDFSNVASFGSSFSQNSAVTAFHAYGMKASFDLSSTALKHDGILEVFNNLGSNVAEGTTLTLGSSKLALMSDEEKKIATDKGWTIA